MSINQIATVVFGFVVPNDHAQVDEILEDIDNNVIKGLSMYSFEYPAKEEESLVIYVSTSEQRLIDEEPEDERVVIVSSLDVDAQFKGFDTDAFNKLCEKRDLKVSWSWIFCTPIL